MKVLNKFSVFLILTFICLLLPASNVVAQNHWYGAATYQISVGMGDTKEFIEETSFLGFGLDYRYSLDKNTTVGINFGWYVFHERTSELLEIKNGAVSGVQDRYLNSYPFMLSLHYYFMDRKQLRPYIGLSAGGYYMLQRYAVGVYTFDNDRWEWGVAPEVGFIIPVDRGFGLIASAKYNYAFTGESVAEKDINHSFLGFNVGFVWQAE